MTEDEQTPDEIAAGPNPDVGAGSSLPPPPPAYTPPPVMADAAGYNGAGAPWVSGWVPAQPPAQQPSTRSSLLTFVLILLAIGCSLVSWQIRTAGSAVSSSAYAAGGLIGTVLGTLLLAAIAYVILRKVLGPRRLVTARWVAAAVPAVFALISIAGSAVAVKAVPADPAGALQISAPYTLTTAPPEMMKAFEKPAATVRVEVREVDASGKPAGYLVIAAIDSGSDYWKGFDKGLADGGQTATPTTIHGGEGRIMAVSGLTMMAWTANRLSLIVYAKDEPGARAIIDAWYTANLASPAP